MAGSIRKYKDGDVIFEEGDASNCAYVILKGKVELLKSSQRGEVSLATLRSGEMFGEMGLLDQSVRSARAIARTALTLKEIPAEIFIQSVNQDPEMSAKVMGKLVERLRDADEKLAGSVGRTVTGNMAITRQKAARKRQPGFWAKLLNWGKTRQKPLEILICPLIGDADQAQTRHLTELMKAALKAFGDDKINLRPAENPMPFERPEDTPVQWKQAAKVAGHMLEEMDGDILIWGAILDGGQSIGLRFLSEHQYPCDTSGAIQYFDELDIPVSFEADLINIVLAACLSAHAPQTQTQAEIIRKSLGILVNPLVQLAGKRIVEMEAEDQARLLGMIGTVLAGVARQTKKPEIYGHADQAFSSGLRNLRRTRSPKVQGIINRHLAAMLKTQADQFADVKALDAAMEAYKDSEVFFTKEGYPYEWAALQNETGELLFKKDARGDGDSKLLRESIGFYQNALKMFTQESHPRQWSDTKHNLGRSLQVLGQQNRDLELIARAAEASREALKVRSRDKMPYPWAATQNNLGSALFMLGQKTRKRETLEAAIRAFQAALDTYRLLKLNKSASVTEKNLKHAERLLEETGGPRSDIPGDETSNESAAPAGGGFEFDDQVVDVDAEEVSATSSRKPSS